MKGSRVRFGWLCGIALLVTVSQAQAAHFEVIIDSGYHLEPFPSVPRAETDLFRRLGYGSFKAINSPSPPPLMVSYNVRLVLNPGETAPNPAPKVLTQTFVLPPGMVFKQTGERTFVETTPTNGSSASGWFEVEVTNLSTIPETSTVTYAATSELNNIDGTHDLHVLTAPEPTISIDGLVNGKVEPDTILTVTVVGAPYTGFGTPVSGLAGVVPPSGGAVVEGSGSTVASWTGGGGGLTSFQFRVYPAWLLDLLGVTEFKWDPDYRIQVNSAYDDGGIEVYRKMETPLVVQANLPGPADLTVNSIEDRPRASGATGAETGFTTPDGDPEVTLRSAIEALNSGMNGPITFAISGSDVPVIFLNTPLPQIARPVVIDGSTSEAGQVLLRGNDLGAPGLDIVAGGSEVRNFVFQGFTGPRGGGVRLSELGGNKITACKFGTDVTGELAENTTKNGISIRECSDNEVSDCLFSALYFGVLIDGEGADRNNVHDNRFGLSPGDADLPLGVGILMEMGEGNRVTANRIASVFTGIAVLPYSTGSDLTISGNSIGLVGNGTQAVKSNYGILIDGTVGGSDISVSGNVVVGAVLGIVADQNLTNLVISGNTVGITSGPDGTTAEGIDPEDQNFGIVVSGVEGAIVRSNTVAGCTFNLCVTGHTVILYTFEDDDEDGDGETDSARIVSMRVPSSTLEFTDAPVADVLVENNIVGLNAGFTAPWSNEYQRAGITLYAQAASTLIQNNTVAGNKTVQIYLLDAKDAIVSGNTIGTVDGSDVGSGSGAGIILDKSTGATIGGGNVISGHAAGAGIFFFGSATNTVVKENFIGTNRGGTLAWPNRRGIFIASGGTSGLLIQDNVIGGNSVAGVALADAGSRVILTGNHIGVSASGLALANGTGVNVAANKRIFMDGNTVAHNTTEGIHIETNGEAEIRRGAVYQNGGGLRNAGISYLTQPFPEPTVVMRRSTTPDGQVVILLAVTPVSGGGPVQLDFFANPNTTEMQGRHYLFERLALPGEPFVEAFFVPAGSLMATMPTFTVTATVDLHTSRFSTHAVADTFIFPDLNFAPSPPGQVRLIWPRPVPDDLYEIVEAPGPGGPFTKSTSPVFVEGGNLTSSFSVDGDEQFFCLRMNPAALLPKP